MHDIMFLYIIQSMHGIMFLYIIRIQKKTRDDKMSKRWCFVLWLNCRKVETSIFYQNIQQQLTNWPQHFVGASTVCFILCFFYTMTLQHIINMFFVETTKHIAKINNTWVIVTILCKLPGNYVSIRQPTFMIARDDDNCLLIMYLWYL